MSIAVLLPFASLAFFPSLAGPIKDEAAKANNTAQVERMMATGMSPTMEQDKPKVKKGQPTAIRLFNNDKVRVSEVTYKPGAASKSRIRPIFRVVRALKSGTLQRIYADGKTENWVMKAGDVKVFEPDKKPFATKNVGTSELTFYIVAMKNPKK